MCVSSTVIAVYVVEVFKDLRTAVIVMWFVCVVGLYVGVK